MTTTTTTIVIKYIEGLQNQSFYSMYQGLLDNS